MVKLFLAFIIAQFTLNGGQYSEKFIDTQPHTQVSFAISSNGTFQSLTTHRFDLRKNLSLTLGLLSLSHFNSGLKFAGNYNYGLLNLNYSKSFGKHFSLSISFSTAIPLNQKPGFGNFKLEPEE